MRGVRSVSAEGVAERARRFVGRSGCSNSERLAYGSSLLAVSTFRPVVIFGVAVVVFVRAPVPEAALVEVEVFLAVVLFEDADFDVVDFDDVDDFAVPVVRLPVDVVFLAPPRSFWTLFEIESTCFCIGPRSIPMPSSSVLASATVLLNSSVSPAVTSRNCLYHLPAWDMTSGSLPGPNSRRAASPIRSISW